MRSAETQGTSAGAIPGWSRRLSALYRGQRWKGSMWFDAVLVKYWKRMLVEGRGGRAAAGRRSKSIRLARAQSDERSSGGCNVGSDRRAEMEISDSEMSDATTLSDSESVPASRRPAANELVARLEEDHEVDNEDEENEVEKLEICGEARWEMAAENAVDHVVVVSAHQCADDSMSACPPRSKRPDTILAVDCEMVGAGPQRNRSMLARCAVVDMEGNVLMDEYVQPTERVTDYRTKWSGIRAKNLVGAPPFQDVRQRAANLIRGKLLIGHAIENDLRALKLPHPPALTRDTSYYPGLRTELAGKCTKYDSAQAPSLKTLTKSLLEEQIQAGEHCPVEDARATMKLYLRHRTEWERSLL